MPEIEFCGAPIRWLAKSLSFCPDHGDAEDLIHLSNQIESFELCPSDYHRTVAAAFGVRKGGPTYLFVLSPVCFNSKLSLGFWPEELPLAMAIIVASRHVC